MRKKTLSKKKEPTKKELEKPIKVNMPFERLLSIMSNPVPQPNQGK